MTVSLSVRFDHGASLIICESAGPVYGLELILGGVVYGHAAATTAKRLQCTVWLDRATTPDEWSVIERRTPWPVPAERPTPLYDAPWPGDDPMGVVGRLVCETHPVGPPDADASDIVGYPSRAPAGHTDV